MAKRKPKAPEPTVFEQMTAVRARAVVAWLYEVGVCCDSETDFRELRDGLKTPERFALPGAEAGDKWRLVECDGVEVAEPEPAREPVSDAEQLRRDDAWRDFQQAHRDRYAGKPETWPSDVDYPCAICGDIHPASDHVHIAIAGPLNALPDDHDLIAPLERADDAHSAWLCLRRWAVALAIHWGMDAAAYWRAVEAAYKASQRPRKVAA